MTRGLLIPGFRKCGTSTLFTWLARNGAGHGLENYKEPQFFCNAHANDAPAAAWYRGLYSQAADGAPYLDGSTLMMADPQSFARARAYFADGLKAIVVLRDPAKRAFSAYWHMHGKGGGVDERALEDILSGAPESAAPEVVFAQEDAQLREAAAKELIDAHYLSGDYLKREMSVDLPFSITDPLWCHRYFGESLYSVHVANILMHIPEAQLFITSFEALLQSEAEQARLAAFCGFSFDAAAALSQTGRVNKGFDKRGGASLGALKSRRAVRLILDRVPKQVKAFAKSRLYKPAPALEEKQYLRLRRILQHEYDYWSGHGVDTDRLWRFRTD